MTEPEARRILGDYIDPDDDHLRPDDAWVSVIKFKEGMEICLDGQFTLEQLEAIVFWLKRS